MASQNFPAYVHSVVPNADAEHWPIQRQGINECGCTAPANALNLHFGSLRRTDCEAVLRDLIDRRVPVVLELGANTWGPLTIYGQHSVVLVGYSERYTDAGGQVHEEYYFVDAQYPNLTDSSAFGLHSNDVDRDGDGVPEAYPGNRTISRDLFLRDFPTGIYFPVFPSQAEHDRWYREHIRPAAQAPLISNLVAGWFTGTIDLWHPT
jgi:hypothetical protein